MVLDFSQLVQALQWAVAPCVLISGAALLMLTLTNRLARPIDRIRGLLSESRLTKDPIRKKSLQKQLVILLQRAKLLRWSILLTAGSITCIALSILFVFISTISPLHFLTVIIILFTTSLILLIGGLLLFLRELKMALDSVIIEYTGSEGITSI